MTAPEDLRYRIAALRRCSGQAYRERERWNMRLKLAGIMVIVLSAFGVVGAIDMQAELAAENPPAAAASSPFAKGGFGGFPQRLAAARELERGLRACPPAGPGMTDVLLMVVHSTPDTGVTVSGCSRIAERSYLPRSQAGR